MALECSHSQRGQRAIHQNRCERAGAAVSRPVRPRPGVDRRFRGSRAWSARNDVRMLAEVCRRSAVLERADRYRAERRALVRRGPASVAQWIEHRFPKPCVAGSIPARGATRHLVARVHPATRPGCATRPAWRTTCSRSPSGDLFTGARRWPRGSRRRRVGATMGHGACGVDAVRSLVGCVRPTQVPRCDVSAGS